MDISRALMTCKKRAKETNKKRYAQRMCLYTICLQATPNHGLDVKDDDWEVEEGIYKRIEYSWGQGVVNALVGVQTPCLRRRV
jgi:hypothetical protein